jgi:hypothetical protein
MKIQRSACLVLGLCLLACCTPRQDEVERITEDGVEVVLNRKEPYVVSETQTFTVEKILTIDTENDEIAGLGLTDINQIAVDSEGKIFVANLRAKQNSIFIFDAKGRFVSAFGPRGEGPGEFQGLLYVTVSDRDEVFATDRGKVVAFSNDGEFIKEFRVDREYMRIIPLNIDRYLTIAVKLQEDLSQSFQALLCASDLAELDILDSTTIGSFAKMDKVNIIPTLLHWETSRDSIFTGNTDTYEIRVFDFSGNLVRKIRKDHSAVLLTEEDKEMYRQRIQNYPPEIKDNFFVPDAYPPFRNIVALPDNRLFVQTYEKSKEGTNIYDVYSPKGIYINRIEFEGVPVEFRGGHAYCRNEKASGYIELVVYRMTWE